MELWAIRMENGSWYEENGEVKFCTIRCFIDIEAHERGGEAQIWKFI